MATTNYFDQIADNQKKMVQSWMDLSNKVVEQVSQTSEPAKASQELLTDWYEKQKKLMETAIDPTNVQESMAQAPSTYQKMLEVQMEYTSKWVELTQEQMKSAASGTEQWSKYLPQGNSMVEQWIKQTNEMIRTQMGGLFPYPMNLQMGSFDEVYKEMQRYWEPILKSIQNGMVSEEMLNAWIKPEYYQSMMGKLASFSLPEVMKSAADHATNMFSDYNNWLTEQTSGFTQNFPTNFSFGGQSNPWMNMLQEMQNRMEKAYTPITLMNPGKQSKMLELVQEAQSEYMSFAMKGVEFQVKLVEAGQKALPEAVAKLNEAYQQTEELPDYNQFFNTFVNLAEGYMINIFETEAYATLQNDMSMAGVKVKNRMDKLMEMAFEGAPFTMRSETEELVKEVAQLKRKIRTVEKALKEAKAETPKPTATTRETSTASKATKPRTTRAKKSAPAKKDVDKSSN